MIPNKEHTVGSWDGLKPDFPTGPKWGSPCLKAPNEASCGVDSTGPYTTGKPVFCSSVCRWNATPSALGPGFCETKPQGEFPLPSNSSIVELVGPSTPLKSHMTLSFYGDSITYLDVYERILRDAIANGSGTKNLVNITLVDQGINGGTVTDLVSGYHAPWGHLDPHKPLSNITFAETLQRDKPDVVAIQIGVNDIWQKPSPRCSNVSVYADVLQHQLVQVAKAAGAKVYLMSVSVIGEDYNNSNHPEILRFVEAQQAVGKAEGIPVIDKFSRDVAYDTEYNCLNMKGNVLNGGSGVHPENPPGATLLANAHAEGLLAALK